MLHLLVDTSTWLDLSKRRDGQRWIVALRLLVHQRHVVLLVPDLVIEEFERNRERIESAMTASVAQRFKLIKQDLEDYGGADTASAAEVIADLARDVPLIGAMTTRNFDEVLELLRKARRVEATDAEYRGVVARGLVVAEAALPVGTEVVGWSGATRTPLHPGGPAQWLTAGLTVDPAFRHRGIGHRLLQAVIEAVGALHGDTLHSVVNARNAPSLALHRSLGFTALETGSRFAGIEFDGGVGVLLTRPTGVSAQPQRVLTLRP